MGFWGSLNLISVTVAIYEEESLLDRVGIFTLFLLGSRWGMFVKIHWGVKNISTLYWNSLTHTDPG